MRKQKKSQFGYLKLSLSAIAVAAGTVALNLPAYAQDDDEAPRQRGQGQGQAGPVQPPSEIDEQAKGILARSAERYKSLQSWSVDQDIVNAGRPIRKVYAKFRAPQNLVVTGVEAKGIKTSAYYDEANISTWRDFDSTLEYQVVPIKRDGEVPATNSRSAFGNALGQHLSAFFLADNVLGRQSVETVKYGGASEVNGIAVDNVVATLRGRGSQPGNVSVTYSIGKQDSLLHKVVQTTSRPDGTSAVYVETYTNQKVDPTFPDSTFKFAPPAGAAKVDRFSRYRGVQVEAGGQPHVIKTKDINGQELSLDQYKGKVVLIDFWATWCGPCRAELPNLKAAYAKYKDKGFDVLGVSFDVSTDPLKEFIAKEKIGWRNTYDAYWNGPIASQYNVRFIPTTILIGRDGKVAVVNPRGAALETAIEAALAKP